MHLKILVVDTTWYKIQLLEKQFGNCLLFLSDSISRLENNSFSLLENELLTNIYDTNLVIRQLESYLVKRSIKLTGIICLDNRSIELTSLIARKLDIYYLNSTQVNILINKINLKKSFLQCNIKTPLYQKISDLEELIEFNNIHKNCIIKPNLSSKKDMVFLCKNKQDCRKYFNMLISAMDIDRKNKIAFNANHQNLTCIAEEYIEGDEFFCEFIYTENRVEIISLSQKIINPFNSLTAGGYHIKSADEFAFYSILKNNLQIIMSDLSIENIICSVEIIIANNELYFLNLSAKPGELCLAALNYCFSQQDIYDITVNNSIRKKYNYSKNESFNDMIVFKIYSKKQNPLNKITIKKIEKNFNVEKIVYFGQFNDLIKIQNKNQEVTGFVGYVILKDISDTCINKQYQYFLKLLNMEA